MGSYIMIEVIHIGNDKHGPFTKVCVCLRDGERVIRWGLDAFTYKNLSQAMQRVAQPHSANQITNSHVVRVTLQCGWDISNGEFTGRLVTRDSDIPRETAFACSKLFAANLRWLEKVSSVTQISPELVEPPTPYDAAQVTKVSKGPLRQQSGKQQTTTASIHRRTTRQSSPRFLPAIVGLAGVACVVAVVTHLGQPAYLQTSSENDLPASEFHAVSTSVTYNSLDESQPLSLTLIHSPSSSMPIAPRVTTRTHNPPAAASKSAPARQTTTPAHTGTTTTTTVGKALPIVWSVPSGEVALSFDDGPSPYTMQILDILNKYHVHATFFFVGQRVQWWPKSVLAVARAGDEIGDHSFSHPEMPKLSKANQTTQIDKTVQILTNLTGLPISLFRPPYGEYDKTTQRILAANQMAVAMWNRDPRDWAAKSPNDVINGFFSTNPSGGLYDMHENPNTVKALPTIIQRLQAQHLEIVMMPEPTPPLPSHHAAHVSAEPQSSNGQE